MPNFIAEYMLANELFLNLKSDSEGKPQKSSEL